MSKSNRKRGFVAAQPAAAIAALDFSTTSQAFRHALGAPGNETLEIAAELADRLISMPTSRPSEVAEKVLAFGWLNKLTVDLSDTSHQRRIAAGSNDAAKGLLAIYLDLSGAADSGDTSAWDRVVGAYMAALQAKNAADEAVGALGDDADDAAEEAADERWESARDAADRAMEALLAERAPDSASLALKARLFLAHRHMEEAETLNPAFLSHFKAEGWDEEALGSFYQDALVLSGVTGPLTEAKSEPFDGHQWLEEMEAATGCVLSWAHDHANFSGGDEAKARATWDDLPYWHRGVVRTVLAQRLGDEMRAATTQPDKNPGWSSAFTDAAMVLLFAEMTANKIGEGDTDEARIRRAELRRQFRTAARQAAGFTPPADFSPEAFVNEVTKAGLIVVSGVRAEIMQPRNAPLPDGGEDLILRFCSLSEDHLEQLTAFVAAAEPAL